MTSVGSLVLMMSCLNANAQQNTLDLSLQDFGKGLSPLNCKWEFYWNQLLLPSDFKNGNASGRLIEPGVWNRQGNYPALGYATYRKVLKISPKENGLVIFFPVINSASQIWLNGELVGGTGVVSRERKKYRAQLATTMIEVPPGYTEYELIVQVANFTHFMGGFSDAPQVGRISHVMLKLSQTQGVENFLAGSLIAMFIYQLVLYALFQRGRPYLWLSLICLGVALRALIVHGGSFLLPNLFPSMPWEIWKKIEFESVYSIIAFFPLYISTLFEKEAPRWPVLFFIAVASLFCFTVLVTPQYVYGQLLEVSHLMFILTFLFAIYSVGMAWRNGNSDARIIFFGVLVAFPFILTEILKNSLLFSLAIQFLYWVELGVLVFLLFQIYLLANHYATSYKTLEVMNQGLEKIVHDRTNQLMTLNRVKDRLLSIVTHDIKSPLNSLRGTLTIFNQGHITAEEFRVSSKVIEENLNQTGLLIENILNWTASQLNGSKIHFERLNLRETVDENILPLQSIAGNKEICIKNQVDADHTILFDHDILNLTLRNLFSNAIKFSFDRGEIIISGEQTSGAYLIRVTDFGMGMNQQVLSSLRNSKSVRSETGTSNEKGTGLGLSLCREYLAAVDAKLEIDSVAGYGSTFSISIPKKYFLENQQNSNQLSLTMS